MPFDPEDLLDIHGRPSVSGMQRAADQAAASLGGVAGNGYTLQTPMGSTFIQAPSSGNTYSLTFGTAIALVSMPGGIPANTPTPLVWGVANNYGTAFVQAAAGFPGQPFIPPGFPPLGQPFLAPVPPSLWFSPPTQGPCPGALSLAWALPVASGTVTVTVTAFDDLATNQLAASCQVPASAGRSTMPLLFMFAGPPFSLQPYVVVTVTQTSSGPLFLTRGAIGVDDDSTVGAQPNGSYLWASLFPQLVVASP